MMVMVMMKMINQGVSENDDYNDQDYDDANDDDR